MRLRLGAGYLRNALATFSLPYSQRTYVLKALRRYCRLMFLRWLYVLFCFFFRIVSTLHSCDSQCFLHVDMAMPMYSRSMVAVLNRCNQSWYE